MTCAEHRGGGQSIGHEHIYLRIWQRYEIDKNIRGDDEEYKTLLRQCRMVSLLPHAASFRPRPRHGRPDCSSRGNTCMSRAVMYYRRECRIYDDDIRNAFLQFQIYINRFGGRIVWRSSKKVRRAVSLSLPPSLLLSVLASPTRLHATRTLPPPLACGIQYAHPFE